MRVSNVTVRRRIFIALLIGVVLYSLLIVRLGYVQVVKGQWLMEKADHLWSRNIPFEAKRGIIYDRNGEELAFNISVPSVMAIPVQIKDKAEAAKKLSLVLGMSERKS